MRSATARPATITAGQTVYLDTAVEKWKLADNNDTAAKAVVAGIALNNASDDQPLHVLQEGQITIGGTVAVGTIYVQSSTAGGIAPAADLLSTNYVTKLGIGITTGEVIAGNVGSERRMHYAVVGEPVNIASRLQSAAGPGQILIDEATYAAVSDVVQVQDLGSLRLAGKGAWVQAYNVIAARPQLVEA